MAQTIDLESRIVAFWSYVQSHKKQLYLIRNRKNKRSDLDAHSLRVSELHTLGKEIHPAIDLKVFLPQDRDDKLTLFIPIKEATYLYYIKVFISQLMPSELTTWCRFILDQGCEQDYDAQMAGAIAPSTILSKVYGYFTEGNPTELNLYSKTIDLYDPKVFYQCRAFIVSLFGEPFVEIFLQEIRIVEPQQKRGKTLLALYRQHSLVGDQEVDFFPPIPFSPMQYPCSYELDNMDNLRNRGRIAFPALLDEVIFKKPTNHEDTDQPSLRGLSEVGVQLYSLYSHYPHDLDKAKNATLAILQNVGAKFSEKNLFYVVGSAEAGKDEDIWIVDLLVAEPQTMLEALKSCSTDSDCSIYLDRYGLDGEERFVSVFDVRDLDIVEMGRRFVAPEIVLDQVRKRKSLNHDERVVQACAYNQLSQTQKAIDLLEAEIEAGQSSCKMYHELGFAYLQMFGVDPSRDLDYVHRSVACYQQALTFGEEDGRILATLAKICFDHDDLIPNAYDLGWQYVAELKTHKTYYEKFKDMFYDRDQGLSVDDLALFDEIYTLRFGEPTFRRYLVNHTGHRFELLYYRANELSKRCHYIVTKGVSSTIISKNVEHIEVKTNKFDPFRLEFIIAIAEDIPLEDYALQDTWVDLIISKLNVMNLDYGDRIALNMLDKELIDFSHILDSQDKCHPYTGNASFRLLETPKKIFKSSEATSPIALRESSELVHFVGITPMYDAEYQHFKSVKNKRSISSFWTLSSIFDPRRAPLVSEPENEEIDFDSLMFTQGLDHISD